MIRCIRGMKMDNDQLYDLLDGIQSGKVKFQVSRSLTMKVQAPLYSQKKIRRNIRMVKWKKMNKKMAGLLLGVMMLLQHQPQHLPMWMNRQRHPK